MESLPLRLSAPIFVILDFNPTEGICFSTCAGYLGTPLTLTISKIEQLRIQTILCTDVEKVARGDEKGTTSDLDN